MRTNQKLATLSLALAASMASFGAQAQSIDVRVIGTVTPPACTPTLTGGGVVDYGNIAASTLSRTTTNRLGQKTFSFAITCDAPTRVAFRAVDNRASSLVPGIVTAITPGLGDDVNFGLGTVSGANVGGYLLRILQGTFTADSAATFNIGSLDGGTTWTPFNSNNVRHTASFLTSWSATNGGVPVAFTTLTGTMAVDAVLNRGDALPLGNDVPLDGSATLELLYL